MNDLPPQMDLSPEVHGFFDPATNTIRAVVRAPAAAACAGSGSGRDRD